MIKDFFEITHRDVAGRIGKLKTASGVAETPTILPVINPNIKFISCKELKSFGAEIAITNAYIIYRSKHLIEKLKDSGNSLHKLLDSDIPLMTDSGSYQLMMYGDVEIQNSEILNFQKTIGSDIAVPLDIPTPPDADKNIIIEDMTLTLKREREAAKIFENSENIIALPIQGSTNLNLRSEFAKKVLEIAKDYDIRCIFPIGGVVPLLDYYRFIDLIKIVLEVKSIIPPSIPVHLFGAGHPMIFAIAVALGCDLFDSAAYALYARDDRYMTVRGTKKLEEINDFPCNCPICSSYTPSEMRKMSKHDRSILLAKHNLYLTFQEIKTVKQAIRECSLFELVESRIRGHPYLLAAWRALKDKKYSKILEIYDGNSKSKFFYTGIESIFRPAVKRHLKRVLNIPPQKDEVRVSTSMSNADIYLKPVFGVIFPELTECYPAGHAELPDVRYIDPEALDVAIKSFIEYAKKYKDFKFVVEINDEWKDEWRNAFLKFELPENVRLED